MSVLIQKLASEIFEILKSYGKTLILYDKSGNVTYDPEQATRIFIQPERMMLSISNDGDDNEVKLYLSNSIILSDMMKLINTLRQTTTRLNSLFNVRKYGKELSPKDFAYQVSSDDDLHESYWGTIRTSYSNIGNCKIIYHHTKNISEDLKGSRSRNIKNIFIENKNKERFLFPTNNINAARALARHISSGGTLFDKVGDYIVETAKEFNTLKTALKTITGNADSSLLEIKNNIKSRMRDINRTFDTIRGSRNYKKYHDFFANKSLYEFTNYNNQIENDLKLKLGNSEEIQEAIPYIVSCMSGNKSLLPYIIIENDYNILDITNNFKRKFKYGIDYIVNENNLTFYNPNCFSDMIHFAENSNIDFRIQNNQEVLSEDKQTVASIEVENPHEIVSVLNTELGLEPDIDYVVDGNNIDFYSGDKYAEVLNLLNTTNTNFIEISQKHFNNIDEEDNNIMPENPQDKILQFAQKWLADNTDTSAKLSPEDTSHDRSAIAGRAESLAQDLKTFMHSTSSVDGIDKIPGRKFSSPRAEQAFKISAVAEASGLHGDMIFNFLTNISEKIRNQLPLDVSEKAVAAKAVKLYNEAPESSGKPENGAEEIEQEPATEHEFAENVREDSDDYNPRDFTNTISISWKNIPDELMNRLVSISFGKKIILSGNNKNGYINYDVPKDKEEMFRASVRRSVGMFGAEDNVAISAPMEVKKPKQTTLGRWKDFLGFKESKEIDEWFNQFDPDKNINEEDNTEDKDKDETEEDKEEISETENVIDDDVVDNSNEILDEDVFDPKDEGKLAQDIEYIKSGNPLHFSYIDNGGKFTVYEENTITPIKDFSDEEVADKICDAYNGRKIDQAKAMVVKHLEDSLNQLHHDRQAAEFTEQEIRELAMNNKLNEYAKTQFSPSYEIDVNKSFGVERHIPISEEYNMITFVSEELFRIASGNIMFEGIGFNPSVFESSAMDIFKNEIKPRLIECGFTFDSSDDEEDNGRFDAEPSEADIYNAEVEANEIINAMDGEELEEDDNQSPIDVARRMGYDAARTGDHDKFDASLRSLMNDHPGDAQRKDIHKAYIAGMDDFDNNHETSVEEDSSQSGEMSTIRSLMKDNDNIVNRSNGHLSDKDLNVIKHNTLDILRQYKVLGTPEKFQDYADGFLSGIGLTTRDIGIDNTNIFHEEEIDEKDLGKPGKNFSKIAKKAGEEYHSKEAGEKVAGAVLAKLRKAHPEKYSESVDTPSIADITSMLEDIFTTEDENPLDDDETIPTNVQATTRNDVSSDIVDNPDQDEINDLRRRAGLK